MRVPGLTEPVELGILDYFFYPVVNSGIYLLLYCNVSLIIIIF